MGVLPRGLMSGQPETPRFSWVVAATSIRVTVGLPDRAFRPSGRKSDVTSYRSAVSRVVSEKLTLERQVSLTG